MTAADIQASVPIRFCLQSPLEGSSALFSTPHLHLQRLAYKTVTTVETDERDRETGTERARHTYRQTETETLTTIENAERSAHVGSCALPCFAIYARAPSPSSLDQPSLPTCTLRCSSAKIVSSSCRSSNLRSRSSRRASSRRALVRMRETEDGGARRGGCQSWREKDKVREGELERGNGE